MANEIVPAAQAGKAIVKREPPQTLGELVGRMKPTIVNCLPQHLNPERMARVALTALRTTKHLSECTQASFGSALLGASLLGLEPNTPLQQCWLVPYKNNQHGGAYECQLLIGYQGMLELARRSGQTHPIEAHAVMQDDVFEYELGLESRLVHKPNMNIDREDYNRLTHVYAICRTKDPTAKPIFVVLTKAQVERRRRRGANGPAWRTDPVAMALKSSVRALFPWIPKSSEMALADMLDMRFEKGRTATATVASMLTDENVASLESTGVDLTADQDDEEPEEPEAEAAVDETPAKVQDAIAKAREHQAKNKPAATADPDADGR